MTGNTLKHRQSTQPELFSIRDVLSIQSNLVINMINIIHIINIINIINIMNILNIIKKNIIYIINIKKYILFIMNIIYILYPSNNIIDI